MKATKSNLDLLSTAKSTIEEVLSVRHHRSLLMEAKIARRVIMDVRSMIHKSFRMKQGSHGSWITWKVMEFYGRSGNVSENL